MGWKSTIFILFAFAESCHLLRPEDNPEDENLFQGDMRLTPLQRILAMTGRDVSLAGKLSGRASMKNTGMLWLPEATVPYTITKELEIKPSATHGLIKAFREWESYTCLKFVPRTDEKDYIEFFNNCSGCWSYVGRQGGKQNICLDDGCHSVGTVVHEIAHAMGFWHEQSRPDRDDYIRVVWENIPQSKKHNFMKHNNSEVDSLGFAYDYLSVMQYSRTAFGNGKVTMDPKLPNVIQLGQDLGFTDNDAKQANALYRCKGNSTRKPSVRRPNTLTGFNRCTFDNGLCYFMQDGTDDFDWDQCIGATPSWGTGPEADRTTGRMGRFVYIEASLPRKLNDTARLISKEFPPTKGVCFAFYYHMFSVKKEMMGTLNIYLRDCTDSNGKLIFQRSGNQGNSWERGTVFIKSDKPYRVVFEGIRGGNYQGDIAIDDVSFENGPCKQIVPKPDPPISSEKCHDADDRTAKYCDQWKKAGFCSFYKGDMRELCPKTCQFC